MLIKIIIAIIILFSGIFLFQRIYLFANASFQIKQTESKIDTVVKKAQDDYFALIEEQKKRDTDRPIEATSSSMKARGRKTIHMVFVKPKNLATAEIQPLIERLSNPSDSVFNECFDNGCVKNSSLQFISSFYRKQASLFGVDDFEIEIRKTAVYSLDSIEKAGDIGYLWGKDPFATIKIEDAFKKVLRDNSIAVGSDDLVIFLFFDNTLTPDSSGEGRFYEHKVFRSFAKPETKRAFVNIYSFNPQFAKTVVEVTAHELLHLFGATDKYEENIKSKRLCSIKGRGNLEKEPILPQESTDIMCGFIEAEGDKFSRGSFVDGNVVINSLTAKEIGWKE